MCVRCGNFCVCSRSRSFPFRFLCLSCRFGFEFMFHATPMAATAAAAVSTTIAVCPYACACLWFYGSTSVSCPAILYSPPNLRSPFSCLPSLIRFKLCTTSTLLTPAANVCAAVSCYCIHECVEYALALWHRSYAPLASQVPFLLFPGHVLLVWHLLLPKGFWHASRLQDFRTLRFWQPPVVPFLVFCRLLAMMELIWIEAKGWGVCLISFYVNVLILNKMLDFYATLSKVQCFVSATSIRT